MENDREGKPESDLLLIGTIIRAHGVKGEFKVYPETDDPYRLKNLDRVFLGKTTALAVPYTVESVKFQPSGKGATVLLKVEGIEDREQAESLRKVSVFSLTTALPPLEDDEVYLHDLIGLNVVTENGEHVGTLKEILEMPAQRMLVVARENGSDVWIPMVPEIVVEIAERDRIVINPIEGLLE